MKKRHDINPLIIIIVCLGIAFLLPAMLLGGVFSRSLDYQQSDAFYRKNKDYLSIAADYMSALPDDSAYYTNVDDIADDTAKYAMNYLFDHASCRSVAKRGGTIEFCLWAKSSELAGGIAYCPSGELNIEFLTESKPLSDAYWYYYVEDFNEYRLLH